MDEDYLRDLFERFGPIAIRKMFGGQGLYADGLIFALVADGEIWIKADGETIPRFEAAGSLPFTYDGKNNPVSLPYWRLPVAAADDPDAVAAWARLGREAALRAQAAKSAKAKPDAGKPTAGAPRGKARSDKTRL